jgi:hypothetical protein
MNWLITIVEDEHNNLSYQVIFALNYIQAVELANRLGHLINKGIEFVEILE